MAKEKKTKRSAAEKAKAQYTGYTVKEPMELMEFLASKSGCQPHKVEIIVE